MTSETFRDELIKLINTHSLENVSNTPDYIIADLMINALDAFDRATNKRDLGINAETAKLNKWMIR
jgi:hypothetical protein